MYKAEHRLGQYFGHAQDDVNLHVLCIHEFEDIFSLHVAPVSSSCQVCLEAEQTGQCLVINRLAIELQHWKLHINTSFLLENL